MSLDTLKYAEELEAGGCTKEIAHIHAVALNRAIDEQIPTKDWLDKKFLEQSKESRLLIGGVEERTVKLELQITLILALNTAIVGLILGRVFEIL